MNLQMITGLSTIQWGDSSIQWIEFSTSECKAHTQYLLVYCTESYDSIWYLGHLIQQQKNIFFFGQVLKHIKSINLTKKFYTSLFF